MAACEVINDVVLHSKIVNKTLYHFTLKLFLSSGDTYFYTKGQFFKYLSLYRRKCSDKNSLKAAQANR